MNQLQKRFLHGVVTLLLFQLGSAQTTFEFAGSTVGGPKWVTPDSFYRQSGCKLESSGTLIGFAQFTITVPTSQNFILLGESEAGIFPGFYFYTSFDRFSPCSNLFAAAVDGDTTFGGPTVNAMVFLPAGTYTVVVSTFGFARTGEGSFAVNMFPPTTSGFIGSTQWNPSLQPKLWNSY